jgi:hypothetical protein
MSVVKLKNKDLLDQLQAQLTLKLGSKPSLQDILDLCIQMGFENTDELAERLQEVPILSDEKIQRIIARKRTRKNIPYDLNIESLNNNDKDIYC